MRYSELNQDKARQFKLANNEAATYRVHDYIQHIHNKCQSDIESKWSAPISNEQVEEILLEETLLPELEKLNKKLGGIIEI